MLLQNLLGNHDCVGELNTALFLFLNQLIVSFAMPLTTVLTVTFMITTHDPGATLEKLQLIKDGVIGPELILLLMSEKTCSIVKGSCLVAHFLNKASLKLLCS